MKQRLKSALHSKIPPKKRNFSPWYGTQYIFFAVRTLLYESEKQIVKISPRKRPKFVYRVQMVRIQLYIPEKA